MLRPGTGRRAVAGPLTTAVLAVLLAACTPAVRDRGEGAATPLSTPSAAPSTTGAAPETSAPPTPQGPCPLARTWTGDTTAFGLNASTGDQTITEAIAKLDRAYGRLDAVRIFDPEAPPHNAWARRGDVLADRVVISSFRMPPDEVLAGVYDDQVRHFLRTTPASVTLFWNYFHEVESNIEAGQFTAAQFRSAFRHLVEIGKGVCRTNLYPTLILTGYTAEPDSGRDWRDYYPGADYVSVLGWDPYNMASGQPTSYEAPVDLYDEVVEASRAAGKPFGIAETGSRLVPGDENGAGRGAWLKEVGEHLDAEGAVFATYFSSIGTSTADYRLRDESSIAGWKHWVTRN
jgi:hypothetical protein